MLRGIIELEENDSGKIALVLLQALTLNLWIRPSLCCNRRGREEEIR